MRSSRSDRGFTLLELVIAMTIMGLMSVASLYYTPWDVGPDGRFIMVRSVGGANETARPLIVVENWLEELKAMVRR